MTSARGGLTILLDEADVDYGNRWRNEAERDQRAGLLEAWQQMADTGPRGGSYAKLVVAIAMTPGLDEHDPIEELQESLGPHLRVGAATTSAVICGWMLQKIRTTPGVANVRVFEAPAR